MTIVERALEQVPDGCVLGLGSGRAATAFVRALGGRVNQGLRVRAVPTSQATATLAAQLGIPMTTFEEVESLDLTVDGADEVDPKLDLIKGLGGALVREKVVAAASKKLIILVGPEKLVPVLGSRGVLPVEVVPFALAPCLRRFHALGFPARPRLAGGSLYVTDNGNHILDCQVPPLPNPGEVEQALRSVPGVVGTGLFLGLAHTVFVQDGETIQVRQRGNPA
jgi:ribose 5-phosphate isomerase A